MIITLFLSIFLVGVLIFVLPNLSNKQLMSIASYAYRCVIFISLVRISSYTLASYFNIDIDLVYNAYLIYAILLILMIIIVPTFRLAY